MDDGLAAAAHLEALSKAMPVYVVYPEDRMPQCLLDPGAYGWSARSHPEWMATRVPMGRNPCWHKAEVAFLHVWQAIRHQASPDLRWVWCTEYDVVCGEWAWLEHTAAASDIDLLGVYLRIVSPEGDPPKGSMLLTCFRASVRFMDWLLDNAVRHREEFCEHVVAAGAVKAGMTYANWLAVPGLEALYTRQTVRPKPPVSISVAAAGHRMWHPVKA